jgi:hypothetical protein
MTVGVFAISAGLVTKGRTDAGFSCGDRFAGPGPWGGSALADESLRIGVQDLGRDFDFVGPALNDPKWFGRDKGIAVRKGNAKLVA